jgi:broad specificity phosphatase PhoE
MLLVWFPGRGWSDDQSALWKALSSGGHIALIRHALAPGYGDPENFRVDDCSTQRNLSEAGRRQARDIGRRFRENHAENVRLFSSQWCRCLDTARLLGLGKAISFSGLNSFFQDRSREAAQTAEVWALIRAHAGGPSLVLVTHQVNITALSGVFPQSGEIVVLRPDGDDFKVLGRIR